MRKLTFISAILLVLALATSAAGCEIVQRLESTATPNPTSTFKQTMGVVEATVVRVIDGDTIEVEIDGTSYRVRYIGIDTPETVHPQKPVECFGKEASEKNRELVEGKRVRLEKDVSDTDKYGRLLRYV